LLFSVPGRTIYLPAMTSENPGDAQTSGQLSPDGNWRWDGHNWVPARQAPQGPAQPAYPQSGQPQYGQQPPPQPQYGQPQYAQQPTPAYASPQYGGYPPGMVPPKKGLPGWAKVLITLLVLFVGLIVLLTVVGLAVDEDYADWSCDDVAKEALTIDDDKGESLALTDVSDLEIEEDNREDFKAPESGRGLVLSCKGTGEWTDLGEAPVRVTLEADADGDQWVTREIVD